LKEFVLEIGTRAKELRQQAHLLKFREEVLK